ncbi:glycosyl transferase [Oscillatoriales cyanobacterium USR001]|nr:glycosyl transferase [Oscillatoriales cyanobacterium USR001]
MSRLTSTPRVSVIIPVYNGDRYIIQAIESVISQTYKNWELIVVDDGSTDKTRQLLEPYLNTIRYIYQENQGVAAARNRGLREAKSELVAFLDQDDILLSDKLAAQVAFFEAKPSLGIVNSGWRIVNEKGEAISDIKPWQFFPILDWETWIVRTPVLPGAMMFSRQLIESVGGFDSRFNGVDDVDLLLRLALTNCESAWLQQVTFCYRQHPGSVSTKKALQQAKTLEAVQDNFFNQPNLPTKVRQLENQARFEGLTWMAWHLYHTGHPVEMVEYLEKSFRYTPYSPHVTIITWVERLINNSLGYGGKFDTQLVRNLLEWKQLMANILPNKKVRVSVIIPTYNCDRYIVQAVESVINQSYKNWEIILIDDGSTDNTRQVLAPYLDLIQYIYQENQGAAIARNHACKLAQGEFLAFLDSDDFFLPEKLEKQVACFDANPTLDLVQTGWLIVDKNGEGIYGVNPWHQAPKLDLETFVMYKCVRPSAMMLRREWWKLLGGFDSRFPPTEDLDFSLRLALNGCKAVWLEEILTCYRQHDFNLMSSGSKLMKSMEIVMENFFARPDLPDNIRQLKRQERYQCLVWLAWRMYRDGHLQEMVNGLEKSLQYTRFSPTETILNWLETFNACSVEYGDKFEVDSLISLQEWQTVTTTAMNNPLQPNFNPTLISQKNPLHILLYTEDHGVGGLAQFNHSLLCKLVAEGYQVTCVQTEISNPLITQQKNLGIRHIWLEFDTMKEFSRITYNQSDAERIFSQFPPDLIVFSDGWPMASFAAKQVAINRGIPYIIALGYIDPNFANFSRGDGVSYLEAVSYQCDLAKAVIAVSQENLNLLNKIVKRSIKRGKVIYYGRPDSYFVPPIPTTRKRLREEVGIPEDAVVCFTAARLTPVKGYQYQLEAIAQLKSSPIWSKIYFVWAGPGATTHDNLEPKLRETVINLGVSNQVKFLGQRWDISDWLDASDIFILPSKAEGMPLAVMEAMAKGLPVIATAVSGIPEELGETGKLLPNPNIDPEGTVKELASTIEAWVENTELRQFVGQECKARAEKMFREERMLEEYLEVIKEALSPEKTEEVISLNPRLTRQVKLLESRLHYCSLVWNAWRAHCEGNMSEMFRNLEASLACTPFFATETILYWVQNFAAFYGEVGKSFDSYSLINLPEWKELVAATVLGDLTEASR